MIKALFWIVVGAIGALEGERQFARLWTRYKPSAMTGTLLDRANRRLEENRRQASYSD